MNVDLSRFPVFDKWGILNWARCGSTRALWKVVPASRKLLIRDAAVRRWRAHYQHLDFDVGAWLDYADWLHANLELVTAESKEDWT